MNIEKKVRYFMQEVGQICTKSGRELKDILVIGASKSQELISIESAKHYIPEEYVDEMGAMFIYPPDHKIDGGFAVRLINND